ncbi:MAG: DUF5050 domain-containing protein [Lachnospiraceae bacterium]|nr:DUF5050 domain-containing protein [Lachnospiraceae bacterium]
MYKRVIGVIAVVLIIGGIVGGVVLSKYLSRIPNNPSGTIGNTSGNLNNKGLVCESGDYIYFSNLNDAHCLYRMNKDGSDPVRLADIPVAYINAGGDYLYFYFDDPGGTKFMGIAGRMSGIYRLKKGDRDYVCLDKCTSGVLNLVGSTLYYEHYDNTNGMQLYHSSLDGNDKGLVIDEIVNPACVVNGDIYFSEQDSQILKVYRPGDVEGRVYMDYAVYNPVADGTDLYFMNMKDNYKLYRYSMSDGSLTKITDERVDTFNVYDGVIFYQRNTDPALIRVNADGSGAIVIAEGNYENINCTSTFTFYSPFREDTMYLTYTFGGGGESVPFAPMDTRDK